MCISFPLSGGGLSGFFDGRTVMQGFENSCDQMIIKITDVIDRISVNGSEEPRDTLEKGT